MSDDLLTRLEEGEAARRFSNAEICKLAGLKPLPDPVADLLRDAAARIRELETQLSEKTIKLSRLEHETGRAMDAEDIFRDLADPLQPGVGPPEGKL